MLTGVGGKCQTAASVASPPVSLQKNMEYEKIDPCASERVFVREKRFSIMLLACLGAVLRSKGKSTFPTVAPVRHSPFLIPAACGCDQVQLLQQSWLIFSFAREKNTFGSRPTGHQRGGWLYFFFLNASHRRGGGGKYNVLSLRLPGDWYLALL